VDPWGGVGQLPGQMSSSGVLTGCTRNQPLSGITYIKALLIKFPKLLPMHIDFPRFWGIQGQNHFTLYFRSHYRAR
jgi:hypothetical protein